MADDNVKGAASPDADRFGGKLFVVLLDNKLAPSIRNGRSLWALSQPLTYTPGDRSHTITVPPGFVTDLASIPRLASILLPPDGPWVKAAIIHDYLYSTGGNGVWWGREPSIKPVRTYTRAEADEILREAMQNRSVGVIKRTIIYLAVRVGGWGGWERPGKQKPKKEEVERAIETPRP